MAKYSTPNGWKQNASSPRLSTLIQKNLSPPLPTKAAGTAGFNVAFLLKPLTQTRNIHYFKVNLCDCSISLGSSALSSSSLLMMPCSITMS